MNSWIDNTHEVSYLPAARYCRARATPPRYRPRWGTMDFAGTNARVTAYGLREAYNSRNAAVTGKRAARTAGNRPPTKPIASAHLMPVHNSSGVTRNWNTTWLKLPPTVDAV